MKRVHIEIFPPGHRDGHPSLWYWSIRSPNDVEICGTSDDGNDAWAVAVSALDGVMQQEAVNGSAEE